MDPRTPDHEDALRDALHTRARAIEPADRLDDVLAAATHRPRGRAARWAPLAAAAAVLLLVGTLWVAHPWRPTDRVATPATPTASADATLPATSTPPPPTPSTSPTPAPAAGTLAALPVYLVAPDDPALRRYRLFREWLNAPGVTRDAPATARAAAAVRLALAAQAPGTDGYVRSWGSVRLVSVRLTPTVITVTLSGPGPTGFTADTQRVSVQQLVWTVQAAAGSSAPVRFVLADGSTALFPGLKTSRTYDRPDARTAYGDDLGSLWVTSPTRGQVLPAGPVTARGEASVFEAQFRWELLRGATVVRRGHVMASTGAPDRGTWSASLGRLGAGTYTLHLVEDSMADGTTVAAESSLTFSVR